MKTIQATVRQEIQDFIHNPITVVQGYEFNQYENVKKTHLYLNSKFYGGHNTATNQPLIDGIEQEEDDRIFFQISIQRAKAVKRFFDVDVADVLLDEIDPQSELALQFLNKDFERWAENNNLSKDLNKFVDPYVDYGSLVLEVLKGSEPEIIPLQNYFVDPTVARSADSRFNTIKYTLSPKELRDKIKDGWDEKAVEALIARAGKSSGATNSYEDDGGTNQIVSTPVIEVYKRYGWLEKGMIDDTDDKTEVFTMTVVGLGAGATKKGAKDDNGEDEVLFKTEWKKDLPIIDTHLTQTHGRWQGIGIIELLYGVQQRMNEVANQKRISMEISALHLFQTADPTVLNNILTDLENGDLIQTKTESGIKPIVNEERNLPAFESEIVTYSTQADKLSFANDLLSGGDIASSTPATNAVIQNNNQVLVHLQDRQNFTNFIANEYIKPWVVPNLIKEMSDEHFLRIVSDPTDLLQIDDMIVGMQVWDEVKKGNVLYELDKEDLTDSLMKKLRVGGANRYVKVLQNYYKEKVNDVIVIIGNEKKDMAKIANNTLQFFNLIQDPSILNDPVNRLFVTNYAKEIGIDTAKMEIAFAKREAQPVEQTQPQSKQIKPQEVEKEDPALAEVL